MSDSWQSKAKRLMADYSRQAYEAANILPNGRKRRRHVPYTLPAIVEALLATLNSNDEAEAKRLFQVERTGSWSLI